MPSPTFCSHAEQLLASSLLIVPLPAIHEPEPWSSWRSLMGSLCTHNKLLKNAWNNNVTRSSYYAHRLRRLTPGVEQIRLRSRVNELFTHSRSAAGSRSIVSMMREDGEHIGRFKVRGLMRTLGLISKQPGSHTYRD